MAGTVNLNKNSDGSMDDFYRGDSLQFSFNVYEDGVKMTGLTNYTFKLGIENKGSILETGNTYLTVNDDTVDVNIPPSITGDFDTKNPIVIEIEMSKEDWVKTIFRGQLKVTEDIVK